MTALPAPPDPIADAIDAAFASENQAPRFHLGLSYAGHHCERWIWLSFRWAVREKFEGRILRLFRRGQDEEARFKTALAKVGILVKDDQKQVSFGAHVSGSIDGIATGLPQSAKPHLVEFKTHSLKSFNDLKAKGVQASKPIHYAQMQAYMLGLGLDRALYGAVCKDDDRLHFERIKLDKPFALALVNRAKRIALSDRLPDPISTRPDWYQCKMCPAHSFCHETKLTNQVSCRTCAHSTALIDSTWHCGRHDCEIPKEHQFEGCQDHVLHPDLVPWELNGELSTSTMAVYTIDGVPVSNGHPDATVFGSDELIANAAGCAAGKDQIAAVKRAMPGAKVVVNA
ncbi:MAG: hypothetical protein ACRCT6_01560 [Notoacmeibacter sp.]